MQNLINIETKNINGELIQTVNARDLHAFLEIGKDFTTWIKDTSFAPIKKRSIFKFNSS